MPRVRKDDSWWPAPLQHIPSTNFLNEEMVTVAELSNGAQAGSSRDFYMALVEPTLANRLLRRPKLLFSYFPGTGVILRRSQLNIEPLVLRWEGGANHYVQVPGQKFLNAYALVPRPIEGGSLVLWDDMAKPMRDVVRAEMVSVYTYPTIPRAQIKIRRDYLLDYADRTKRTILIFWYERNDGPNMDSSNTVHAKTDYGDFFLPGRMIGIKPDSRNSNRIVAEFWGVREVYHPSTPRVQSANDIAPLLWPGLPEPVTRDTQWSSECPEIVYVKDAVLDEYEEHPETYLVHPDDGSVSYRYQWSVSYCHRIGRDLIALEIKKLYERAPVDVIQHWHRHAVEPPSLPEHRVANIGMRAKRIVDAMLALGIALSDISAKTSANRPAPKAFIGLDGEKLGRTLWYDHPDIRPITRRISLEMGRDAFLDRCEFLEKLIIEGLGERPLRRLLIDWGTDPSEIAPLRALKLLDRILQLASIAKQTGLSIPTQSVAVQERYQDKLNSLPPGASLPSPVTFLFRLHDIRSKIAAHRGGTDAKLLAALGVTQAQVARGWGDQLDRVYDQVGDSLESASREADFGDRHTGRHL